MDFNDECTFFRSDFPDVNLLQIEFQRSGSPLSLIQRGRCLVCGKASFCIAKLGPFVELLMVPSQILARETLPEVSAEVYCHRRVSQASENTVAHGVPQISGHVFSQMTILRIVLASLFKASLGSLFLATKKRRAIHPPQKKEEAHPPQKKEEALNIHWIFKDDCQNMSKQDRKSLKALFSDSPLLHHYPAKSKVNIQIEIRKRIPMGSQILNGTIWNLDFVNENPTPAGFPRATLDQFAEQELLLVEILHITGKTGGMGSYFGYLGYYYSVIVDLSQAQILDVRGDKMS